MYRLKEDSHYEIVIKKSRFLCYLHKCLHEEDAKAFVAQIKKDHPNANHHCYAFVIGEYNEIQRSNDDGEPSGTAGVPMLECIMHHHMQDMIAVTVRYFGGTKLGAGGLIRAYSNSVNEALKHATITKKESMLRYSINFPYEMIGKLDYFFRNNNIQIIDKTYAETVSYTYLCKQAVDADVSELSNGVITPTYIDTEIVEVDSSLHTTTHSYNLS